MTPGLGGRTEIYRKHLTTASQADLIKSFEAFKEKCVGGGPAAPTAATAAAAGGGGDGPSVAGGGGVVVGAVAGGGGAGAAAEAPAAAAAAAANGSGYSGLVGVAKDQFENAVA